MCTYLSQRGATYYFRRVIPAESRPAFGGRSEFMLSLRTKDRAEAKRRIPAHTITTDGQLDRARAMLGSGTAAQEPSDGLSRATASFVQARDDHAQEAAEWAAGEDDARQARYDARAAEREQLERQIATFNSVDLPLSVQAMRDLIRERDEAVADAQQRLSAREAARFVATLPPPIGAVASPAGVAQSSGVMLDTLIVDRWAAERKVQKKGLDAHRAVATWFYDRVGRKPVGEISRKDVLAFKVPLSLRGKA